MESTVMILFAFILLSTAFIYLLREITKNSEVKQNQKRKSDFPLLVLQFPPQFVSGKKKTDAVDKISTASVGRSKLAQFFFYLLFGAKAFALSDWLCELKGQPLLAIVFWKVIAAAQADHSSLSARSALIELTSSLFR